jgi:hypothetical protein
MIGALAAPIIGNGRDALTEVRAGRATETREAERWVDPLVTQHFGW